MALFNTQSDRSVTAPAADDWKGWMRLGAGQLRAGAITDAVLSFEHAAVLRPDDLTTTLNLATAVLRSGNAERSLAIYDQLMRTSPAPSQIHHGHGLALNAMGKRIAAIDAFCAAVTIAPDAWRSWESIADITAKEDEKRQAVESVAEALERACGNASARRLCSSPALAH